MNAPYSTSRLTAPDTLFSFSAPTSEDRLDLCTLHTNPDFALKWVDSLVNKGVLQTTIEAQSVNEPALRRLFFESRNRERLTGRRAVAFGFPIVAIRHEGSLLSGPLFIWQLHIDPSPNLTESWTLTHGPEDTVSYNTVLVDAIEQQLGVSLRSRFDAVFRLRKPSGAEVAGWVGALAAEAYLQLDVENLTAVPCPDAQTLGELPENGGIFWSGLIGLIPEYAPQQGEIALPEQLALKPEGHPFGLADIDPYQASALEHLRHFRLTAAEGISGTGKTQLLLEAIINALSNGKKCLVLSSRLPALNAIQNLLSRQGIFAQHVLIRDAVSDQLAVTGLLRTAVAAAPLIDTHAADRFKLLVDKAQRLKEKLDAGHTASRRPVFGAYNWTETVGLFLHSQRKAGKELLGQQLYTQDFTFTFEEYESLRQGIERSQILYPHINTLKHPLSVLRGELFTQKEKKAGLAYIRQQIAAFSERAARLHHRYISTLNAYSDKLHSLYQTNFQKFHDSAFLINGLYTDLGNQYGADFEQSSEGSLQWGRLVSARAKNILQGREQVRQAFAELERSFSRHNAFDFPWLPEKERRSISKLKHNLQAFKAGLTEWHDQLSAQVQEEVQRLGANTVHPDLPYNTIISELEQGLDTLLVDLNEAGLFQQPLEHKMLTLPKRLKFLEEVIENLDNIRLYLKDYDDFYDWQRHWLGLPENGRKVVRALVKVKPQDWAAALDSWYFNNCLANRFSTDLPTNEDAIEDLAGTLAALQPLQLGRIASIWQERRDAAGAKLRRSGKKISQLLSGNPDPGISLPALFAEAGDAVTDIFPVVLAVPQAAKELFNDGASFDYVLVDEAQAVPAAEAAPLLHLGKRVLICGDPAQLPDEDDFSLLGYCRRSGLEALPLNMIHQLKPGNLLQSVYPVIVADETTRSFRMTFSQVHGFFNEDTGINEKEAQAALQLLNQVELTPQRTLPRVGIVCATPQQRDLISYYLLRIKQKNEPGADVIQQLERNGLGVFHWGELPGQNFDELIFSATFGPTGPRSGVSRQIEQMEGQMPQLSALMSRSAYKIHALCSIDEQTLHSLAGNAQKPAACLLANFILFIQAFQAAKEKDQQKVIERVGVLMLRPKAQTIRPVFHEEVAGALKAYLGSERLGLGEQIGATVFPLLILNAENRRPMAAVRADGSLADTPATDWRWEYEQRKRLKNKDIAFIPVWSAAWWRDAKEEARKLAGTVLKISDG
jgi:hypothetical protein